MLAGIREILIITTPDDQPRLPAAARRRRGVGLSLQYAAQPAGRAWRRRSSIGADFIGGDAVALVLGDNIFYGHGLGELLQARRSARTGATVFGYQVAIRERYGVVEFDASGRVDRRSRRSRPSRSRNCAVTGLYFYDATWSRSPRDLARPRAASSRSPTSTWISAARQLHVECWAAAIAWLDTGTHERCSQRRSSCRRIEERQGLKIACLEEIAWRSGWIDADALLERGRALSKSDYGRYLLSLPESDVPGH